MSGFSGKSILLVMPADLGIAEEFRRNLERLGFTVRLVTNASGRFRYRNFLERFGKFWRTLLGDRTHKRRLILEFYAREVTRLLAESRPTDYALVLRADLFTHAQLARVRQLSERCYAYHWDGLSRFPGMDERRGYFRRLYVFDPGDARPEEGIIHQHNFWFDRLDDGSASVAPPVDAYYIGSYDSRAPFLMALAERLRRQGLSVRMILGGPGVGPRPALPGLLFPPDAISYVDNLEQVRAARVILDVPHLDVHRGLSLRVFEALGAGKKLITTNPYVLEADFYHPDNIHLLTDDDAALARFLAAPAVPVDPAVRLRHGFSAWIRRVLEEPAV